MTIYSKIEKLLSKNFTDEDVSKIIGEYKKCYIAHASDETIRKNAASGGVVSAILIQLLQSGEIDGALVCKEVIINSKVRTKFFIATSKEEILQAQGSKYVATKFASQSLPLIKKFQGKLAIVGLPCNIAILTKKAQKDYDLMKKIVLSIALVCGHNSQNQLIDTITDKLEREAGSKLQYYRFRKGLWRGQLEAIFNNNQVITKPFSYFSDYQNLFFFAEKKCLFCHNHFGYDADISICDIWSYDFKKQGIKKSGIVLKTNIAVKLFENILQSDCLEVKLTDANFILEGQKRAAPFHYNISARHKVGKIFGLNIPDKVKEKVKWHEYLCALIVLFNWTWSQNKKYNKYIFKIPRPLLKLYLYLFKGLESLR